MGNYWPNGSLLLKAAAITHNLSTDNNVTLSYQKVYLLLSVLELFMVYAIKWNNFYFYPLGFELGT